MSSSRTSSDEQQTASSSSASSVDHNPSVANAFRRPLVTVPSFKREPRFVKILPNEIWKMQSHTDFSRLHVDHPNFVRTARAQPPYHFSFEPIDGPSLEWCLKHLSSIKNDANFDAYRDQLCKSVLLQLVMAVFYLEHILRQSPTEDSATPHRNICPKTIDFRLDGCLKLSTPNCVPPRNPNANDDMYINSYTAPEVIAGTAGDFVSDMFSIGVVAYSIMKCECLLPDDVDYDANSSDFHDFNDLNRHDHQWLALFPNNNIRHLVGRLLTKDPAHRINSLDALVFILRDHDDTWSVRSGIGVLQDWVFKTTILQQLVVALGDPTLSVGDYVNILVARTSGLRNDRRSYFFAPGSGDRIAEFELDFGRFVAEVEARAWSNCKKFLKQVKPDE